MPRTGDRDQYIYFFLLSHNDLKNNFGGVVGAKARLEYVKKRAKGQGPANAGSTVELLRKREGGKWGNS